MLRLSIPIPLPLAAFTFIIAVTATAQIAVDGDIPGDMNAGGSSGSPAEYIIGQSAGYNWAFSDSSAVNAIRVGYTTDYNQLTIQNGATADMENELLVIGNDAGSDHNSITVDGSTTTMVNVGNTVVGQNGSDNSLTIQSGGSMTGTGLYVGGAIDETGNTLTITGSGSSFNGTSRAYLGSQSDATVDISNGGTLSTTSGIEINWESSVTVTGESSNMSGSYTYLFGGNSLSVLDGATVDVGGLLRVGSSSGDDSNLLIDGADSILTTDRTRFLATSELTISNQALFISGTDLTANAASLIRLDEGFLAWSGDHVADVTSFITGSLLQVSDGLGGWTTATTDDLSYQYFSGDNTAAAAFSGYSDLGGYTIITSASAVPEPSAFALILGIGALGCATRRRQRSPRTI